MLELGAFQGVPLLSLRNWNREPGYGSGGEFLSERASNFCSC
jgi:hypothetical protein